MNKKGSIGLWAEVVIMCLLAVILLNQIIGGFNLFYNEDHQLGLGTNATETALIQYSTAARSEINSGEPDYTTTEGLSLTSSWSIAKSVFVTMWDFVSGNWIDTLVYWMKMPVEVAILFKTLYLISLILGILYILFKVKL